MNNFFTLELEPTTKKTGQRIVTLRRNGIIRNIIIPSKKYKDFEKQAIKMLKDMGLENYHEEMFGGCPLHITAIFYSKKKTRRDLTNLEEALADVLQYAKVIINDCMIESWDGSRKKIDKDHPRVEFKLEPFEEAE